MKRFVCATILTLWVAGCSQNARDVRPELKGVYQAARGIEGALAVGVSYGDFATLVREMSKEMLLARDKAKYASMDSQSAQLLDKYGELLAMYTDSATVWQLQIQGAREHDELAGIAAKYGVPIGNELKYMKTRYMSCSDFPSGSSVNPCDRIRETIWAQASKIQEQQTAAVYGRLIPTTVQKAK